MSVENLYRRESPCSEGFDGGAIGGGGCCGAPPVMWSEGWSLGNESGARGGSRCTGVGGVVVGGAAFRMERSTAANAEGSVAERTHTNFIFRASI